MTRLRSSSGDFLAALTISTAFGRVRCKSLLTKVPSFGLAFPLHFVLLWRFFSSQSLHHSCRRWSNFFVFCRQWCHSGSVLSPTLILLPINDLFFLHPLTLFNLTPTIRLYIFSIHFPSPPHSDIRNLFFPELNTFSSLNRTCATSPNRATDTWLNTSMQ